ncbi:hypothetical protein ACJMK2_028179, partial [Sinanodonta woodiana]
ISIGNACYKDDACIDEHARCIYSTNPASCRCMDGYYTHQGSCIPKSALGGTCLSTDHCISDHVICDNIAGLGVCVCSTGYYAHKGLCYG